MLYETKHETSKVINPSSKKLSEFCERMQMTFRLEKDINQSRISQSSSIKLEQVTVSMMLEVVKELLAANEKQKRVYHALMQVYDDLNHRLRKLQRHSAEMTALLNQ